MDDLAPPPPTAYLALALSFVLLNIYVHICWLDTKGRLLYIGNGRKAWLRQVN